MSDTPETDKLLADYGGGHPHPMEAVDLSRRLERERNEARLIAAALRDEWADERGSHPRERSLPWELSQG